MNASISRRLLIWLSMPLAALVLIGALGDYYLNAAEELARSEQRLVRNLQSLTLQVQSASTDMLATSDASLRALTAAQITRYVIRNDQGQVIAGDARMPIIDTHQSPSRLRTMIVLDHVYLQTLSQRVSTAAGPVTITVAEATETMSSMMRFGLLSKLLWDFILLDVMLIVAWFGVKVGLRPLRRLRDEIAGRSPQDLRPIVEASAPQELAPLITTLNRLFALVQSSIEAQQQLVANTAHQLRTPITGINAQLELLIDDPKAVPIKERLLMLQEGIRQLTRCTNQLLTLARADSAVLTISRNKPINLETLVRQLVTQFVDRAVAAHIDLGVEAHSVWINADESLLNDLLGNLIDNALKYTSADGLITVSAGVDNGHPFIEVDDNGRGIPISDYQRVRQRYYRSANATGQGTGLGLAIVDEITRLYRGTLTFTQGRTGRGTCVRVLFAADLLAVQT